jgi:putative ABC transport system substrate-binding protein
MQKLVLSSILAVTLAFVLGVAAEAQQPKVYRIGVLVPGDAWYEIVDGLRVGLKELGLEEGKQFVLSIQNWKGNAKKAEEAARKFEQQKVDLIYATSTNSTVAARKATEEIPIVFAAGTDPVIVGLVDGFANPGGRLTGVYSWNTELTAKRLELLKEIVPKLRRVVTFYDPRRPTTVESSKQARETARRMHIQFVERHVASVKEFQAGVRDLKAGEFDGYLEMAEPIAVNQSQLMTDTARILKLPTMVNLLYEVINGALATYAVSFHELGRVSAKYVQRVLLAGVKPKDLPVERVDKIELVINLKTGKEIGLAISPNVLALADRVIK